LEVPEFTTDSKEVKHSPAEYKVALRLCTQLLILELMKIAAK